jgi:hypothetical protein
MNLKNKDTTENHIISCILKLFSVTIDSTDQAWNILESIDTHCQIRTVRDLQLKSECGLQVIQIITFYIMFLTAFYTIFCVQQPIEDQDLPIDCWPYLKFRRESLFKGDL